MNVFKKIYIKSEVEDIRITQGSHLEVINGSYCIDEQGCLSIYPNDDVVVTIPSGFYEEIEVETEVGDCLIELNDTKVERIAFRSEAGDLTVDADCQNISFNSFGGDYLRIGGHKNNKPVINKPPMKAKTVVATIKNSEQTVWKGNERYK